MSFLHEVTVVVQQGSPNSHPASGILMRRSDGKPFVLTARHLVENDGGIRLGIPKTRQVVRDAARQVQRFPNVPTRPADRYVDIAVLALSTTAESLVNGMGASIGQIEGTWHADDYCILTGYARGLTDVSKRNLPGSTGTSIDLDLRNLYVPCEVNGHDDLGRLKVAWQSGPIAGTLMNNQMEPFRAEVRDMTSPLGISGAGLWKASSADNAAIWSPRTHLHLLGICSSWNQRDTEFVEVASEWLQWLHETTASL